LTRLHILSDLHCEFDQYRAQPVDADVIVLAGDIDHGTKGLEWARSSFPHNPVICVAGNREYYGKALPKLTDELRARSTSLDIAFLENDVVEIGGLRLLAVRCGLILRSSGDIRG
jgi:predicted phosphodiesterase